MRRPQKGSELNDMAKNLILWLIIAAVLVTVMNNFSSPVRLHPSRSGWQVERVTVDGYIITGKRSDGDSFKTVRPAITDNGLIGDLVDNHVVVEGKQPEQQASGAAVGSKLPDPGDHRRVHVLHAPDAGGAGGKGDELWQAGAPAVRRPGQDDPGRRRRLRRGQGIGELVEFLRDPGKFQRLGGRIPRGVLMVGLVPVNPAGQGHCR